MLHIGRNLSLNVIEIWESTLSQEEIIRLTRGGIKNGKSLNEINKNMNRDHGKYPPNSIDWANSLLETIGDNNTNSLPLPYSVFFKNLNRWQIE